MPRPPRSVPEGIAHHVAQRGVDRQDVFFTAADRQVYLALLHDNLGDAGVKVLAFCLMSNHVHGVVVPERADSLGFYSVACTDAVSACKDWATNQVRNVKNR